MTIPGPDRERQALQAAHLYYMQDLTMDAIARELNTSRSSVSRLLTYARESGLVEINICSSHKDVSWIQEEIGSRYNVSAHIVPVPDNVPDVVRLDRVALTAARTLNNFIDSNMTIGVAWGSTVTAVSRSLTSKPTHNSQIVQLNGAGNPRTSGIVYASEILRRFGDAYGAQVQEFPVPAFFDDPNTKRALWNERSTKRIVTLHQSMDVAIFGIGSPLARDLPSHVYMGGYLEPDDFDSLRADGVVGDIATHFYRLDGSSDGITLNARASGPDLDTVRRTPRRICVVAGMAKVPGLRGALRAGAITDVVLDEGAARAVVEP